MIYADFDYYQNQYCGERLSGKNFDRCIRAASAYLDRISGGQTKARPHSDSVRLACCAVADVMAESAAGRIRSEMVGNWSRAFCPDERSEGRRLFEAASLYLDEEGILFRGVCDV